MLGVGLAALACVVLLWAAALSLPFMQGAVAVYWPPIHSRMQGLLSVLGMGFAGSPVQPVTACLVVVGALYTLRRRRYLWLTCSYALACCIYYASAVEGDTLLKHALSGFWYTDPYRTAALAGILALPLLAMGLYVACKIENPGKRPDGDRAQRSDQGDSAIAGEQDLHEERHAQGEDDCREQEVHGIDGQCHLDAQSAYHHGAYDMPSRGIVSGSRQRVGCRIRNDETCSEDHMPESEKLRTEAK